MEARQPFSFTGASSLSGYVLDGVWLKAGFSFHQPEVRRAKPVSSPSRSLGEHATNAHETKTRTDPVGEYWKQFDRGSNRTTTHAEVAANLRAREAAATAKVTSEAARRHGEYLALVPHKLTKAWIAGIRTDKIGVDLLVKRGVTDRQLAELIRWYTGLPLLSFASLGLVALRRKLSC